jgi:hypothetical protein
MDELEGRMAGLRAGIRRASAAGDSAILADLKRELDKAQAAWDAMLEAMTPAQPEQSPVSPASVATADRTGIGVSIPLREQVHHALTLLTVPAAPRLIVAVNGAFFGTPVPSARLTSLRRDEQRSFETAPFSRPYYLCPALTSDRLGPARGLLSISTWTIAERIVGPLSPRVHFLTAAVKVAEAVKRTAEPRPEARRLVWRFAANIPGGTDGGGTIDGVAAAARAELAIHEDEDRVTRETSAKRARPLTDKQKLFGVPFGVADIEDVR